MIVARTVSCVAVQDETGIERSLTDAIQKLIAAFGLR